MKRIVALIVGVALSTGFIGCSDTSKVVDTDHDHDHDHGLAWIWVSYPQSAKVAVYHSELAAKSAEFDASMHATYGVIGAGSEDMPSLWMAGNNTIYAFTTGFDLHGDHAHMATPRSLLTIPNPGKPVHMARSVDGSTLAFANDDSSTVSMVNVRTGGVTRVSHGSPHSSLVIAGSLLLTTHAQQRWVKIIDVATDSLVDSIPIDEAVHGNAYHAASNTAFFPCLNGIEVIDITQRAKKEMITYSESGRTPLLFHGVHGRVAVGLHRIEGTTNKLLLIDMQQRSLEYLTVANDAVLPQRNSTGRFAISENGMVAAVSDTAQAAIYVIDINPASAGYKTAQRLDAPAEACALTMNHDGSTVWALKNNTVYEISVKGKKVEKSFAVAEGAARIFATSFDGDVYDD